VTSTGQWNDPAVDGKRLTVRLARSALTIALATVLTVPGLSAVAGEIAVAARPDLVINDDFADPDISRFDDRYYAYSTNNVHGNVPVASAPSVREGRGSMFQASRRSSTADDQAGVGVT
jgi:hypothetical protein